MRNYPKELLAWYKLALEEVKHQKTFEDMFDCCRVYSVANGIFECQAVILCKSSNEMMQAHNLTRKLYDQYNERGSRNWCDTPWDLKLANKYGMDTKENLISSLEYYIYNLEEISELWETLYK